MLATHWGMAENADVIKVEILLHPDGGAEVLVPPVDTVRYASLLESAAVALRRAAESAERNLETQTSSD